MKKNAEMSKLLTQEAWKDNTKYPFIWRIVSTCDVKDGSDVYHYDEETFNRQVIEEKEKQAKDAKDIAEWLKKDPFGIAIHQINRKLSEYDLPVDISFYAAEKVDNQPFSPLNVRMDDHTWKRLLTVLEDAGYTFQLIKFMGPYCLEILPSGNLTSERN